MKNNPIINFQIDTAIKIKPKVIPTDVAILVAVILEQNVCKYKKCFNLS